MDLQDKDRHSIKIKKYFHVFYITAHNRLWTSVYHPDFETVAQWHSEHLFIMKINDSNLFDDSLIKIK